MGDGMSPDRWQKIKESFINALELVGDERAEYLKQTCGNDHEMLNEVFSLLEAYDHPGAVDRSLEDLKTSAFSELESPGMKGRHIGPYRIVDELGYGGMGTVYLAERADGEFEQQVALKLLRTGFTSEEQIRRFRVERQILATLNHKNIARLYDGGITDDGQPYFVMEYVEGQPIDKYCDAHKLTIVERLTHFLKVCDAVQYAHRKLIVHRDIKPCNILVTDDGKVKLVDFGIAKVLNSDEVIGEAGPLTRIGLLPLTPTYASPEQVRGEPITVSSDIYQLGIVLYELLTDIRPYNVTGRTPSEIERIICDEEPTRPSTALTKLHPLPSGEKDRHQQTISGTRKSNPEHLRRRLRGDMDTIVMQSLRKEPDRRYESTEQLAADVRRYLAGKPVSAHPDSWTYRTGKFIRRNRFGVAAITSIVLLLIGYGVTITWHSQRTQAALEEAEREKVKSQQVVEFMMGLFEASDPVENLGDTVTARVLLERGIQQAQQLSDQPAVQAQMFDVVGRVYTSLGRYKSAEANHRKAVEVKRNYFGSHHPDVAHSLNNLAIALTRQSRFEEAASLHRQALYIQTEHFGDEHPQVAQTQSLLGSWYPLVGIEKAEELREQALEIRRATYGSDHLLVASSLMDVGKVKRSRVLPDEAEAAYREAMEIRKRLLGPDHPDVAESMIFLADLYREYRGNETIAESLYTNALKVQREAFGEEHPSLLHGLGNLSKILSDRNEHEEAERLMRQSVHIRQKVFGDLHPATAEGMGHLAHELRRQGRLDKAEGLYRESLELWEEIHDPDHLSVSGSLVVLGNLLVDKGEYDEADTLFQRALKIRRHHLGEKAGSLVIGARARLYAHRGDYVLAEKLYHQALSMFRSDSSARHNDARRLRSELAGMYDEWGKSEKAGEYRLLAERD